MGWVDERMDAAHACVQAYIYMIMCISIYIHNYIYIYILGLYHKYAAVPDSEWHKCTKFTIKI